MDKKPLIGVSICAVVFLVLASLTSVVGYQTVQSSNQTVIDNEVNQKEVLFQTILDIVNNKEIKGIILKSQISKEGFFNRDVKFPAFKTPVLTMNQLKQMYLVGLILSKTISKTKIHSMIEKYSVNNQVMQKEITVAIEKDATLNGKITQLSNSECDCENEDTTQWSFPILCTFLGFILIVLYFIILGSPSAPIAIALFSVIYDLAVLFCNFKPL